MKKMSNSIMSSFVASVNEYMDLVIYPGESKEVYEQESTNLVNNLSYLRSMDKESAYPEVYMNFLDTIKKIENKLPWTPSRAHFIADEFLSHEERVAEIEDWIYEKIWKKISDEKTPDVEELEATINALLSLSYLLQDFFKTIGLKANKDSVDKQIKDYVKISTELGAFSSGKLLGIYDCLKQDGKKMSDKVFKWADAALIVYTIRDVVGRKHYDILETLEYIIYLEERGNFYSETYPDKLVLSAVMAGKIETDIEGDAYLRPPKTVFDLMAAYMGMYEKTSLIEDKGIEEEIRGEASTETILKKLRSEKGIKDGK